MSQKVTEEDFDWTGQKEEAAQLLADDRLTDQKIAEKVGVERRTLLRWKQNAQFAERIDACRKEWQERVMKRGIANRQARIRALQERQAKLEQVLEARAQDPKMAQVPGGDTGMLVRQVKLVKVMVTDPDDENVLLPTKTSQLIEEYSVDTATLAEMRAIEKQAAQELGQWSEKKEISGEMLLRRYEGVSLDEV